MGGFFLKLKELFSQKTRYCGRGVLAAAVLLALCGMQAWGTDYQWNGTAGDDDWENPANWTPNTGFPQAGDNVTIPYSANPLTFTKTINVASLVIDAQNSLAFTGAVNAGTLYVHGRSSLDFSADLTVTDFYVYANYGVDNVPISISGGSASIGSYHYDVNGQGTLADSSTITVASGASLEIGSGTIPNLVNDGSLNITGSLTVDNYSGSGTYTGSLNGVSTSTIYYWIGEGTPDTWNDADNWSTDNPTTATAPFTHATDYPKSGDTAIFNTAGAHSFSENITVAKIENASGDALTITTLTMDDDCEIKNTLGTTTIGTLSGAHKAKLDNSGASGTTIVIDRFENTPAVETTGQNMNLGEGIISSFVVKDSEIVIKSPLTVSGNAEFKSGSTVRNDGGMGGSLTINGNLINNGNIGKPNADPARDRKLASLTVGGTTTTTGSIYTTGNQTYTGAVTNSGTMSIPAGATLTLGGNFTNTGTLTTNSTSKIIATGIETVAIDFGTSSIDIASFTYEPREAKGPDNKITITTPTGSQSSFGNFTAKTLPNVGNAQVSFTGNNKFNTFNAEYLGRLEFSGGATFDGNFSVVKDTNLTLNNANTFNGNFAFIGDDSTGSAAAKLTLNGANTFNGSFSFANGQTITVNAAQTVTGTLSLSGKSSTDKLIVGGSSGSFAVSSDQTARYLSVNRDAVEITGGNICTAYNSVATDSDPNSTYHGWKIEAGNQTIIWTGAAGTTAWETDANWQPQVVPGTGSTADCDVLIPNEYDDGTGTNISVTKFPVAAAAAYTVSKITIESGANNPSVTISASGFTASEIENDGVIKTNADFEIKKYDGSGSIENSAVLTFDLSAATTVKSITNSGTIEKSGTADLAITTLGGSTCTLKRNNNGGKIYINGYSTTDVPEIVASGTDIFLAGGTIASLTVDMPPVDWSIVNLTGDLKVTGDVTLNSSGSIIQSNGTGSLIVEGNIDNSAGGKIGNGTSRELASLEVTGTTNNAGQIETTGNQTYTGAVTNSGTMVVPAKLTLGSSFTNTGTYTGTNSEIIAATTSLGGIINFGTAGINAKSLTYSPTGAANLVIDGTATFSGDFTASNIGNASITFMKPFEFVNFTVTGSNATLTISDAKAISVTGTLTLSGADETNPLTIAGDGQFNLSSEQTTKYLVVGTDVKICDSAGDSLPSGIYSGDYLCKVLYSKYSDGTTGVKNGWCIVGDTITWTGGAGTTVWTTPGNWDVGVVPGIDDSGSGGEDTTIYKVLIPVKYNGSNIGDYPVAAAAYTVKDLTIGGDETISDSMTTDVSVTVGAGNIEVTGTFESYGKIIYSGAGRITDGTNSINDVTNNGTVEYTTATHNDLGTIEYYNLMVASGATVSSSADVVIHNNMKNEGVVNFANDIIAKGVGTSSDPIIIDGGTNGIKANEFKYEPTTVSGATLKMENTAANTFANFTASNLGGATLIINGEQTVSGTLTLSGDSTTNLKIEGSGKFKLSSSQSGQYLEIARGGVSVTNSSGALDVYYYQAIDSQYDSDPRCGIHNGWIIINDNMTFIWTGDDDTNWGNSKNWDAGFIPGANYTLGGSITIDTTTATVIIPVQYDDGSGTPVIVTQFPVAAAAYTVKDLTIGDNTISDSMANTTPPVPSVKLGAGNIEVTGTFESYGKIIYSGAGRITDGTNSINDVTNNGTVEYTTATHSDLGTIEYYNLIIASSATVSSSADVVIHNNMKNEGVVNFANDIIAKGIGTSSDPIIIDGGTNGITANEFKYEPTSSTSATIKISGDNTWGDTTPTGGFTATSLGGATIIVSGTQAVKGTLSLSGNSFSNLLTIDVDSAGNFTIEDDQFGEFLQVKRNAVSIETSASAPAGTTYYYYSTDSLFDSAPYYGEHNQWVIFNEEMEFIWTSASLSAPNEWSDRENWNMKFVPGLDADKPNGRPIDTRGYNVLIPVDYPVGSGSNLSDFPTASDEYTIGNLTIGDSSISASSDTASMTTDVTLTLDSADNIILAPRTGEATIVNYGRIVYSAEGRIVDNATPMPNFKNDAANKGTVEYNSVATTLTDFYSNHSDDYANFIIGVDVTNAAADIIVAGKTLFESGVSVTSKSITFKRDVEANGAATINGDVYLSNNAINANSTIGNGTDSFAISGNLHVASSVTKTIASSLTATNILLYSGTLEANADLSITGDLILLGRKYDIADNKEGLASSSVDNLFAYNHVARDGTKHAAVSYSGSLPPVFPDGSSINIATGNGTLTVASGTKITVGKNFYANGITINGAGIWKLEIPDNDSQVTAFAEIYNSSISNCEVYKTGTTDMAYVAAAEDCDVDSTCKGFEKKRPLIKEAYTVYDDLIFVSFGYDDGAGAVADEAFIENSNNEISTAASHIFHNGGENSDVAFVGTFIDADCTTSTNGKGDISSFYIKTVKKWNTDATGISAGVSNESTDRSGTHRTAVPYLNLPKAFADLYETLRDNYKNRIAHYYTASPDLSAMSSVVGKTYTKVEDQCAPVLVAVYTGQELHSSDVSQQKDYDAHNFIEYRYSEQVAIGDGTISIAQNDVNIQATSALGAVTNNASSGFTMAGLGIFSEGKIEASLRPGKTGEPHSLYRNFSLKAGDEAINNPYKIRVAVAGYVDGVIESVYKNWTGYISSAICPQSGSATVLPESNVNITDLAKDSLGNAKNNVLDATGTANHPIIPIVVNAELVNNGVSTLELYGTWDVTPPSFAPMRVNEMAIWERPSVDGTSEYEIVGMSYNESMLSALEFHMFDNEPTYNESLQWFSRIGWAEVNPSEPTEYSEIKSYAADIIGGSRPYSQNSTTSGGIRYSSVYDSKDAFLYSADEKPYKTFSGVQQFAQSSYFKYIGGDKNPIDTIDGHYLSLALNPSDTMLTGETNFLVKFDSTACFITDLAGNRIQCGNITMKSIDRAPPAFNVSAVPLGNKKMLIVFAKALNVGNLELYKNSSSKQIVNALENIPKSLTLKDAEGNLTDIQITNDPAQCVFRSKKATGIIVSLNREAVLNDIVNGTYITVENGGTNWYDPLCGTMGEVTYLQDEIGNFIRVGRQHTLSDFAVNAVQMQYAYPILDHSLDKYDTNQGTFVMRDWNAEQERSGYINENKEIILHGALYDGTNNNSGGLNEMLKDSSNSITAYFDASPNEKSIGDKVNNLMQGERIWRIWLPNTQNDVFENFASENNTPDFAVDGDITKASKPEERRFINFDIPEQVSTDNWKAGDQVSFLFKLGNYQIRHNGPDEDPQPLYCLRLKDLADLTSLDLWSFKLKDITLQRGGVTILANVINVNAKEKTTVQVDMQSAGNLSVMVMTLDGNIVKYLHHGRAEKGTHYYLWDGTNNGGSAVARGLYFVRVIGPGIDETRKVMCVKK